MASRPNKVTIGLHEYQILWSKESWKKYAKGRIDHDSGICQLGKGRILINGWDLIGSEEREVLFHELQHACYGVFGFADAPFQTTSDSDTEEVMIRLLSPTLLRVLRDNPEVVAWLLGED